jgi:hypothetical protein
MWNSDGSGGTTISSFFRSILLSLRFFPIPAFIRFFYLFLENQTFSIKWHRVEWHKFSDLWSNVFNYRERSVNFHQSSRRHIPQDSENLISLIRLFLSCLLSSFRSLFLKFFMFLLSAFIVFAANDNFRIVLNWEGCGRKRLDPSLIWRPDIYVRA